MIEEETAAHVLRHALHINSLQRRPCILACGGQNALSVVSNLRTFADKPWGRQTKKQELYWAESLTVVVAASAIDIVPSCALCLSSLTKLVWQWFSYPTIAVCRSSFLLAHSFRIHFLASRSVMCLYSNRIRPESNGKNVRLHFAVHCKFEWERVTGIGWKYAPA
jgi:hypothetical protein